MSNEIRLLFEPPLATELAKMATSATSNSASPESFQFLLANFIRSLLPLLHDDFSVAWQRHSRRGIEAAATDCDGVEDRRSAMDALLPPG
jgi:hypothetical protein